MLTLPDFRNDHCFCNFAMIYPCALNSSLTGLEFTLESLKQDYYPSMVAKTTYALSQATMTIRRALIHSRST